MCKLLYGSVDEEYSEVLDLESYKMSCLEAGVSAFLPTL